MPSEKRKKKGIDVILGRSMEGPELVRWNSESVVNFHWVVIGDTGTGKTFTLRRILKQLVLHPGFKIHVFDSHGDLSIGKPSESIVKFSESTTHGINPFEIDTDKDWGGIRRNVAQFLSMVDRYTSPKLGARQQRVLRNLCYDMFAEHGYFHDKPETWSGNGCKPPSLISLKEFLERKYIELSIGGNAESFKALQALARKKELVFKGAEQKISEENLEELKSACFDSYNAFLATIKSDQDLKDLRRYDDPDVLQSLLNRVENLYHSGIFCEEPPRFGRNLPLWLYDIHTLETTEAGFLVEVYLSKIFARARRNGISTSGVNQVILIDEAQTYVSKQPDHILNQVMREGRKFGISVILATQSFDLLPADVITNCGCKVVLGVDGFDQPKMSRKLGKSIEKINAIKPRNTGLVQLKTQDLQTTSNFTEVNLRYVGSRKSDKSL